MLNELYMPELIILNRLTSYLKKQDWEDVSITKTFTDIDVEFNIFLKSNGQTFMRVLSKTDFENLIMAAMDNVSIVRIQVCGDSVSYVASPNMETVRGR